MRYTQTVQTLIVSVLTVGVAVGQEAPAGQRVYESPEAAAKAFITACEANDTEALIAIFGPLAAAEFEQTDDTEEQAHRAQIAEMAKHIQRIEERSDTERALLLGYELWPFPMPIVLNGSDWRFDTQAGFDELLRRRVGMNEFTAIGVCHEYVIVQREYVQADHDGDGVFEFAQKILSTPGKRDGLYWEADPSLGDTLSPFGPHLAAADASVQSEEPQDYMGYRYRVLTSQGKHAVGGEASYLEGDKLTQGFALVAWPVDYGRSGVMTFLVDHLGAVYDKNLGPETESVVTSIKEFDPGPSWKLVTD